MKVIFATGNKGKLREVKNIFADTNLEIISLEELNFNEEIEETGLTFYENAFIKADAIFNKFKIPTIADDSGLAVDQLDGQPGVFSARYAGENVTYDDNNRKLLKELENFPQPHFAKFVCCAVFVDNTNRIAVNGELKGEIIKEFKGTNGFGFDPIFQPESYKITLAEMNIEEKNKISHRSKAFNLLKEKLVDLSIF
ncbi:MAG: RdgB/HAM1 family non-canonical purine NTP pyrophosphatase [Ignavibacteriae bacterium]|nr:RdgB/HAM1 family non-canonical purine NTP pyrophosphatase [Ignavibacteriota bacterium]MCB9209097.1 RdgB/HAM1 family non-canonical purine NTP pyrophosphatase [Ignavibacteriales bacterium]MCB9217982.1 RdgB/HAM1 family non-canonical purine NTP pyrophosphatase [Ignavibacteriales bacterium]MCB9260371.1 RdgB/HAM1 family non-canonical purine NTP pyrophosphatase [Ignavibacteriales bacterium]